MGMHCFMKKPYLTKEENILQSCSVAIKHDIFLKTDLASESLSLTGHPLQTNFPYTTGVLEGDITNSFFYIKDIIVISLAKKDMA